MTNHLWVIMPVYNEEESINYVVNEWLKELRKHQIAFTFAIFNDGSKDSTLQILKSIETKEPEIKVIDKPNTGHGQTCIEGYQYAINHNADWVFQIDSDGQCDPSYFGKILNTSKKNKVVYGFRTTRDDGISRYFISRIVSIFAFLATGVWVRDANVPYRMMAAECLVDVIKRVPEDFNLANILVAVLQQKWYKIHWENIHFRDRHGGTPSVKTSLFAKKGFELFKQLRKASR